MREIARQAGVGVATLYRHFPHREALISAAFADQVQACLAHVATAADDLDPWRALVSIVDEICIRQATHRGFNAALLGSAATSNLFADERHRNAQALAEVIRRAHTAGVVRTDVCVDDLRLIFTATAALTAPTPEETLAKARRLGLLLLRGMRTVER